MTKLLKKYNNKEGLQKFLLFAKMFPKWSIIDAIKEVFINENVKSYHPLYLYVINVMYGTNTLLISNRDIKRIIDKIIFCSENPKKSWINDSNIIEFTITEDQHASWEKSMNINYDINNKKFFCDGYDDKSQKNNKINKKLIDWDKKTIHIYNGNTYTL